MAFNLFQLCFSGTSVYFRSKYDTRNHWILTVCGFCNQCDLFPVVYIEFYHTLRIYDWSNEDLALLVYYTESLWTYKFKDTDNFPVALGTKVPNEIVFS